MTITDNLKVILADSYALYLKTQNYHWNVTGPEFKTLHLLFEDQYNELSDAIDEIAERIRALDSQVGKFSEFIKLSSISEATANIKSSKMLEDLVRDQDIIISTLTNGLKIAQQSSDEASADIIIQRIKSHQKNKWMLVSSLDN